MSDMPWVRFFPSDWLAGTRGMSAAETGIYITLIATMYEKGAPIAEDHARLARLCGASNAVFKKALETLIDDRKIQRVDGGLWNDRVGRESEIRSEKSEVGSRAANARWGNKRNKNNVAADANALPEQSERNANQKPEARIEKEKPPVSPKSGTRWQKGQGVPEPWLQWGREHFPSVDPAKVAGQARQFADYWPAKAGKEGVKLDWEATWRNWLRKAFPGAEIDQGTFSADLVSLGPDDPDFELVERYRGKPFLLGNSGKATVKRSEVELARKAAA